MNVTRSQVELWVKLVRERAEKGHVDLSDVVEVLEKEVGTTLSPSLPQTPISRGLDDDALADALADDLAEALDEDAAGAVWDMRVEDLAGPVPDGCDRDAAVRAWTIAMLRRIDGLAPSATIPVSEAIDSLERLVLGKPRGSAPR